MKGRLYRALWDLKIDEEAKVSTKAWEKTKNFNGNPMSLNKDRQFDRPFLYPFETGRPIIVPEMARPERGSRWYRKSFQLNVRHGKSYRLQKLLDFMMKELATVVPMSSPRRTRLVLETAMLNLLESWIADLPVNYSRNKNTYTERCMTNEGFFTYARVIPVINGLKRLGYIHERGGIRFSDSDYNKETRMWGTPKLWATFEYFSLINLKFASLKKPEEVIILRNKEGNDVRFRQTNLTRRMTEDLEQYNDFIDGFKISVSLNETVEVDDEFLTEYLYRNLTNSHISLTTVQYHDQSVINQFRDIYIPQLITVSKPPQYLTNQTTITNTIWRKGKPGLAFQGFNLGRDKFMNFLRQRARVYWPKKAEACGKKKKRWANMRPRESFPLSRFGIEHLEFCLRYEYLHRIFNNSRFDKGGRAYGALHQNLPRHMRRFIMINDQPTVEVDYSAYHILMLYHEQGIDYQEDPYEVCEGPEMRDIYKVVGLVAINAPNELKACGGLWDQLKKKKIPLPPYKQPLKTLIKNFKESHPRISQYLYSNVGLELQNRDSQIMNGILVRLMDHGILGLSVYDSVIVKALHEEFLKHVMIEEYEKVMGFKPRL